MSSPATWVLKFERVTYGEWAYYIDGVLQGYETSRENCLKQITKIVQGQRKLKYENSKTK